MQGEYESAIKMYLKAKNIYQNKPSSDRTLYMRFMFSIDYNIAIVYTKLNKYSHAETLLLDSISKTKKLLDDPSYERLPDLMWRKSALGNLYYTMKHYEKAEKLYMQSINIASTLCQRESNTYISVYNRISTNLSLVYEYTDRFSLAVATYNNAYDLFCEKLTIGNNQTLLHLKALTVRNISYLYQNYKMKPQTRDSFYRALKLYEDITEPISEQVLVEMFNVIYNLYYIAIENKEYNEVYKQSCKQVAISEKLIQINIKHNLIKYSDSIHKLANCYKRGVGVSADFSKVYELYAKSAEYYEPKILFNLAMCYRIGLGVKQDEKNAFDLFIKASDNNHPRASLIAGIYLKCGVGINKDLQLAYQYIKKTYDLGNTDAKILFVRDLTKLAKPSIFKRVLFGDSFKEELLVLQNEDSNFFQ